MTMRSLAFATVLAAIVTAYFVVAATVLERGASTSADHAVVNLVTVLLGASGLVTLCLLATLARLDDKQARQEGTSV